MLGDVGGVGGCRVGDIGCSGQLLVEECRLSCPKFCRLGWMFSRDVGRRGSVFAWSS